MPPTSVLITGGSGFLAPNLAMAIAEKWPSTSIHCLVEPGTALPQAVARDRIRAVEADLLSAAVPDGTRLVVHCAAIRDPGSQLLHRINVEGTLRLADQAAASGADFIYMSTQSVYGSANSMPARESDTPLPDNTYGRTKLEGERMVAQAYADATSSWVALRLARLYGVMATSRYDGMLGRLLVASESGETVTIRGEGASVIDFLHIRDACSAILALCEVLPKLSGAYNLSSGDPTSVLALAKMIRRHRPRLRWEPDPSKKEQRGLWLDTARIETALGWRPGVTMESGVAEALAS